MGKIKTNSFMIDNRLYDGPRNGPSNFLDLSDGLGEDEEVGLELEDRKSRRSGSIS